MVHDCGMVLIAPSAQELSNFANAQMQKPIEIPASKNYSLVQIPWAVVAPQGKCD
jgi:hypothetical protein